MPSEPRVKLGKVGNCFKVIIPADMIQDLGWKEGEILRIGLDDGSLPIHKDKQK